MEIKMDPISEEINKTRKVATEETLANMAAHGFIEIPFEEAINFLKKYLNKEGNLLEFKPKHPALPTESIPTDKIIAIMSKATHLDCVEGTTEVHRKIISENPGYNFDLIIERGSTKDQPPILSTTAEYLVTTDLSELTPTEFASVEKQSSYQTYLKHQGSQPGNQE